MTRRVRFLAAASGTILLVAALSPGMRQVGAHSFTGHMVQHELLIAIATPLLALGRPLLHLLALLPPVARRRLHVASHLGRSALLATAIAGVVLWAWHIPSIYGKALADDRLHTVQHLSMIAASWWSWGTVFRGWYIRSAAGSSLAALLLATIHTSLLGAWLSLGNGAVAAAHHGVGGVGALEDQQVAGLVMWVPGCLTYLLAAIMIIVRLLRPRVSAMHATGAHAPLARVTPV